MTIEVIKKGGDLTVKLSGRLDSTTAGELDETMTKQLDDSVGSLNIDLTDVDFISSRGLRVLVGAYKTMNGRQMTLTGANQAILDLLKLSGLLKIFSIR